MEDKVLQEKLALLNVTSNRLLCDKAKEIYRKLLSKLPIGSLGRSEQARPILAIEISCRLLNVSITHEKCARLCSVNQSEYVRVLNTCKVALGVQWGSSNVDQVLSLQYSPDLVEESKRILNYYDSHYVLQLPTDSRRYVALDSPLYKCAAFYVAAATAKQQVKVDKNALATMAEVTVSQLMKVYDSVREVWTNGRAKCDKNGLAERAARDPSDINRTCDDNVSRGRLPTTGKENEHSGAATSLHRSGAFNAAEGRSAESSSNSSISNSNSSCSVMQRGKTFGGMGNGSQYNVSAAEEAAGSQAGLVAFGKRPFHAVGGPTTEKDKLLSLLASNRQPVASLQKAESAPSQQQQDAVPDTTAREAYEVWKEAMKQRKRAKLDR